MFKSLGRNNRFLMLSLFIWALGEGLWYFNLRQLYLVELGATEAQVGLSLAIEAVVRGLLPIPAGIVASRIGAQRVMVASWFLGLGGPLIGALAQSWQMFVPGLAIYALSSFAIPSVTMYALQNVENSAEPGVADRVLTAVFAVYPAGLIISPTIGGLVADAFSIRTCLWISTGIFAISTLIILLTRHIDVEQFEYDERPRDLLRNTRFVRLALYSVLVFFALFVAYELMPNYLQEAKGLSFAQIGLLFSVASLGTSAINLLAGRANPRWNFALALGVVWLALLVVWRGASMAALIPAFFGVGTIWVVRTLTLARIAGVVSGRNQALAFGVTETALSIAAAAAAGTAGRLFGLTPGHELPLVVAIAAIPVVFGLWFVVRTWLPLSTRPAEPDSLPATAD